MAQTSAAVQAELGTGPLDVRIIRHFEANQGTLQQWYASGGAVYPGRVRLVTSTAADTAADQATSIKNALAA